MKIKKNNGWIIISDIINGYYTTRKYMYFTEKEAMKQFKDEMENKIEYKMFK